MVQSTGAAWRIFIGAILASSVTNVSAASICGFTTRGCSIASRYACCSSIAANVCCKYPTGYGWSTRFSGQPSGSFGYVYGDSCNVMTGGASSTNGQVCISVFDAPSYLNAKSAKWILTPATRSDDVTQEGSGDCEQVDIFGFTGHEGRVYEVRIPVGRTFGELEELAQQGRYDEILKLANAT